MIAAKQYIQDVRMRNLRRKVTLSPCFEFASVIIKKILLTNPFDSPFYELLTLLIFASCIDFPPTLSLPAGKGGADKRILPVRSSSFKSRYMKFTWGDTLFLGTQALPGKGWKMATTRRTKYGVFRNNILLSYESCCRRYMSNIIDSSALIFLSLASFFFIHGKYYKTFWLKMSSPTSRHSPVKNLVELTPVLRDGASEQQKTAKVIVIDKLVLDLGCEARVSVVIILHEFELPLFVPV